MNSQDHFLFAAVHKGPYLSIKPLEEELGAGSVTYLVEGVSKQERANQGLPYLEFSQLQSDWGSLERFFDERHVKAVIRSSSVDVMGYNVEELASVAAERAGIRVFVVEDFPGNYWPKPAERLDSLFIEDDSLVGLHRSRGVDPGVIRTTGNPRYGALAHLDRGELRRKARQALEVAEGLVVLWAGQPDGENSFKALQRLLRYPGWSQNTLLFRAHPRDSAYTAGRYQGMLAEASLNVRDVTSYPDVLELCCGSDLVITQFSSVAVEAGYLGVPGLFVLFDDLGKQYLRCHNGVDTLPWCQEHCSFLIEHQEEVDEVLGRALSDGSEREKVRTNFERRFVSKAEGASVDIAHRIRELVGDTRNI
jgi:hypothetical protein